MEMDKMKLKFSTAFMRNLVADIISKIIKSKTGVSPDISLNEIDFQLEDGRIRFHLNIDAECSMHDVMPLLKSAKNASALMDKQ